MHFFEEDLHFREIPQEKEEILWQFSVKIPYSSFTRRYIYISV